MSHIESFDCKDCQWGRHCDDKRPGPEGRFKLEFEGEIIESRTCFKPMIGEFELEMVRLYPLYKQNVYPFLAGIYEQPAPYFEAMELIERLHIYNGRKKS